MGDEQEQNSNRAWLNGPSMGSFFYAYCILLSMYSRRQKNVSVLFRRTVIKYAQYRFCSTVRSTVAAYQKR